jgi:hypothetical protein
MAYLVYLLLALAAAPALGQDAAPPSPFLVDEDALDRRYGIGGSGDTTALPPSDGAALGAAPRAGYRYKTREDRSRPSSVGSDVVDERGAVQPDSRPFLRF